MSRTLLSQISSIGIITGDPVRNANSQLQPRPTECRTYYPVPCSGLRQLFFQWLMMLSFSGKRPWLERAASPRTYPPSQGQPLSGGWSLCKSWSLALLGITLKGHLSLGAPHGADEAYCEDCILSKLFPPRAAFFSSLSQVFVLGALLIKLSTHHTPSLDLLSGERSLQKHWHLKCLNFGHVQALIPGFSVFSFVSGDNNSILLMVCWGD